MIVVSNTSPLHYFVAVDQAHVLSQLFANVSVPPAVIQELSHPSTPIDIRQWISKRPLWLRVQPLTRSLDPTLTASLDQGEAEAIQLAEEQNADVLMLDEWKGRAIAQQRGLPVTGALGILGRAYQQQFWKILFGCSQLCEKKDSTFMTNLPAAFRFSSRTRYAR